MELLLQKTLNLSLNNDWVFFLFFFFLGLGTAFILVRLKIGSYNRLANEILHKAELEADTFCQKQKLKLKEQELNLKQSFENAFQKERKKIAKEIERLHRKEDFLQQKEARIDVLLEKVKDKENTLKLELNEVLLKKQSITCQLEKLTGMTSEQAKTLFKGILEKDLKKENSQLILKYQKELEEKIDYHAAKTIATAINRLAVPTTTESTICTISLNDEEMKGRIIGKEGRNIRLLEKLTGANFIVDEGPSTVVISSIDPIRRAEAKETLKLLLIDGRIYPTKIEEAFQQAKINIQKKIKEYGEDASIRAGAIDLDDELKKYLGKLKFRVSLNQNILDHSLEVSYIMGLMAAELKLDCALAKRIGLLHDIGKAISHETCLSHAIAGHDLALKYGESKKVANGIGCHHREMEPITVEASLCSAADAISASRPGARIEAVEEYIRRLKKIEDIASGFPGVEKAYAVQAGKELRVIAIPEIVDESSCISLARDIRNKIEKESNFNTKVTVIREQKATV